MKTWQAEMAAVATVLLATVFISGGHAREFVGAFAVLCTFGHAQVSDRMAEQQHALAKPSVSCFRWSQGYYLAKEALWLAYFTISASWTALVGVFVFLAYPLWRRAWRARNPLSAASR